MTRIVCENHIDLNWPDQCSCGAGMPLTERNLAGLYAFMLNPQQENATMSNQQPERQPATPPETTMPFTPVADIRHPIPGSPDDPDEKDDGHVNKNQKYPDGMIPGYERISPAKPKAKAAAIKHPVKRSAKRK